MGTRTIRQIWVRSAIYFGTHQQTHEYIVTQDVSGLFHVIDLYSARASADGTYIFDAEKAFEDEDSAIVYACLRDSMPENEEMEA